MEFNEFCETVAEKLGVKLIPLQTEHEFAHHHIFPAGMRPTYEEYCKRRYVYKNGRFSVYFENFSNSCSIDFQCEVYDAQTNELFGYVEDFGNIISSYYNRDDGYQEVYYNGADLTEAAEALLRHEYPVLVW